MFQLSHPWLQDHKNLQQQTKTKVNLSSTTDQDQTPPSASLTMSSLAASKDRVRDVEMSSARSSTQSSPTGLPIPRKISLTSHVHGLNSVGSSHCGSISSSFSSSSSSTTPMSSAASSSSSSNGGLNTHLNHHLRCHQQQQQHPYHDHHPTGHQPFSLSHYNQHLYQQLHHPVVKHHRRLHLPQLHATPFGRPHLLGEDVPIHHTIDMMDTTPSHQTDLASQSSTKSHSGPTSLYNVLSQVVDASRVTCKVKVEPLIDTYLTTTTTASQESELSGASCYGTL